MTENMTNSLSDSEALNALAQKYLNLWVEHWAAAMAAPETAAALARLFNTAGMTQGGGIDLFAGWPGAGLGPAPIRTAHDIGDGRVDELERRIAALEQRLAGRDAGSAADKPAMGRPSRKPNRGSRAI